MILSVGELKTDGQIVDKGRPQQRGHNDTTVKTQSSVLGHGNRQGITAHIDGEDGTEHGGIRADQPIERGQEIAENLTENRRQTNDPYNA
ncbi:hypothetical protein DSECCO2_652980 [anaerobic digester metagenome]